MAPSAITIDGPAAPHSNLIFMFWGEGLFIFPLMLLYVAAGLSVFKGRFDRELDTIDAGAKASSLRWGWCPATDILVCPLLEATMARGLRGMDLRFQPTA
jgi:hypothetical protein